MVDTVILKIASQQYLKKGSYDAIFKIKVGFSPAFNYAWWHQPYMLNVSYKQLDPKILCKKNSNN